MENMLPEHILLHYHEIALKGENREWFERKLIENVRQALSAYVVTIKRMAGRIMVHPKNKTDIPEIIKCLQKIFGIAHILHVYESVPDLEKLGADLFALVQKKDFHTFRITSHRANKNLSFTSGDADRFLGNYLLQNMDDKKVQLKNPDLECTIHFVEKYAFIMFGKIPGPGGLPVGVSGKIVSLISSGIDSPVAAWCMAKRGAKIIFVHFHSYPYTDASSQENVRELVNVLNAWQGPSKIHFVPFIDIQKDIIAQAPEKLRVILYRRAMIRIAEEIARKEGAQALVTGESLGQVASQTLENINTVDAAAVLPIFRPLIGMDKREIIDRAKGIGTYDISIRPYKDCCSLFTPKHPETKASIAEVEEAEKKLNRPLINTAVQNSIEPV